MLEDIRYEGAFLRGALLVGLFHERDVHEWAEALIDSTPDLAAALADILSTPVELSPIREALWPLAKEVDVPRVGMALLTAAAVELLPRKAEDRVSVLALIRADFKLPAEIAAAIKKFENRKMFAAAGVETVTAPGGDEVTAWLDRVHAPGFFRFYFDDAGEASAFEAAVARKIDRYRTERDDAAPQTWTSRDGTTIGVNESAWRIAAEEFSPLPVRSRIPFADADMADG